MILTKVEADTGNKNVAHLHNDKRLKPNATITVYSSIPFLFLRYGSAPMLLYEDIHSIFSSPDTYRIHSKIPLGRPFAQGWAKLPNELQLAILSNIVVADEPIMQENTQLGGVDHPFFVFKRLLRTTPEIANLARAAFYKGNVIAIRQCRDPNKISVPESSNVKLIRRLILICDSTSEGWDWLKKFEDRKLDFEQLQHVTVSFELNKRYRGGGINLGGPSPDFLQDRCKIKFACQGSVEFKNSWPDAEGMPTVKSYIEELEKLISFE